MPTLTDWISQADTMGIINIGVEERTWVRKGDFIQKLPLITIPPSSSDCVLEIYTASEKLFAPLLQTGVHLKIFHFSLLKYSVRWEALPEPKLLYLPPQSHEITLDMLEVMPHGIISAHKDEEKRSVISSVNLPVTSQISDQHKCQDEKTRWQRGASVLFKRESPTIIIFLFLSLMIW